MNRMKIVSALISAVMLLSVVGSLGTAIPVQTVDAEHNSEKSVYYFSDTEPILDESDMKYYFGHSNNYEYDLQYGVNQKAFAQMVEEFHFEDYAGYDIYSRSNSCSRKPRGWRRSFRAGKINRIAP